MSLASEMIFLCIANSAHDRRYPARVPNMLSKLNCMSRLFLVAIYQNEEAEPYGDEVYLVRAKDLLSAVNFVESQNFPGTLANWVAQISSDVASNEREGILMGPFIHPAGVATRCKEVWLRDYPSIEPDWKNARDIFPPAALGDDLPE